MLKILVGVGLGFLLFTNPEARQITADLHRAAGDVVSVTTKDRLCVYEHALASG